MAKAMKYTSSKSEVAKKQAAKPNQVSIGTAKKVAATPTATKGVKVVKRK